MTSRRLFVASATFAALGGTVRPVAAQAFKVPDPIELRDVLRAAPPPTERIIQGTDALRTLLWQVVQPRPTPRSMELWQGGSDSMLPLRLIVSNADALALVLRSLDDPKTLDAARASTAQAIGPARKMEDALHSGGLARGSPLANFLFQSFFQFDQVLVVQGKTKQRWYCEIYPFSVFC